MSQLSTTMRYMTVAVVVGIAVLGWSYSAACLQHHADAERQTSAWHHTGTGHYTSAAGSLGDPGPCAAGHGHSTRHATDPARHPTRNPAPMLPRQPSDVASPHAVSVVAATAPPGRGLPGAPRPGPATPGSQLTIALCLARV